MKRILTQALVSILSVLPMTASADYGPIGGGTAPTAGVTSMMSLTSKNRTADILKNFEIKNPNPIEFIHASTPARVDSVGSWI